MLKKVASIMVVAVLALAVGTITFWAESSGRNTVETPVERSGQVTRVDIPNGDGTFTTLKGAEAQAWYNQVVGIEQGKTIHN